MSLSGMPACVRGPSARVTTLLTAAALIVASQSSFVPVPAVDQPWHLGHHDLAAPLAAAASSDPAYHLLKPAEFRRVLGEDYAWATENIPLFESANATVDSVYYFRWRTYKTHLHPTRDRTDGIDFVVTEFSPNVSWAGKYNTINVRGTYTPSFGGDLL